MEEKHIFTTNRWVRFLDKLKTFQKTIQESVPKLPKKKPKPKPFVDVAENTKVVQPTTFDKLEKISSKTSGFQTSSSPSKPKKKPDSKLFQKAPFALSEKVITYTLLLLLIGVFAIGAVLSHLNPKINQTTTRTVTKSTPTPFETSQQEILDSSITDWKTYTSDEIKLSLKYPQNFSIEENNKSIQISSPSYMCREKGSEKDSSWNPEMHKTSEIYINLTLHEGRNYEQTWLDSFDFKFEHDNTHYIKEEIGGKTAHFFHQGAEMSFGRKAILVEISDNTSLEINIFTPIYTFECLDHEEFKQDEKYRKIAEQILSTFQFIE